MTTWFFSPWLIVLKANVSHLCVLFFHFKMNKLALNFWFYYAQTPLNVKSNNQNIHRPCMTSLFLFLHFHVLDLLYVNTLLISKRIAHIIWCVSLKCTLLLSWNLNFFLHLTSVIKHCLSNPNLVLWFWQGLRARKGHCLRINSSLYWTVNKQRVLQLH